MIINNKFGKLIPLEIVRVKCSNNQIKPKYKCICDCGKETIVFKTHLLSGETKSCGCLRTLCNNKNKTWKGFGEIPMQYWSNLKRKANERNILFDINIEDAWNLFLKQNRECSLSGIKLNFKNVNGKEYATASLDRINPKLDYIIDNIQWIHKDLNFMKQDFSEEEFFNWIEIIYLKRIKE